MILTLRPNSDIQAQCDTFGYGTGHYGRVNEVTRDDTNGVRSSSSFLRDVLGLPSTGASGDITNVMVRAWAWGYGAEVTSIQLGVRVGGTSYRCPEVGLYISPPINPSCSWPTNPKSLSVWTWEDINSLQVEVGLKGAYSDKLGPFYAICSQLWVEVEHGFLRKARIFMF